MGRAVELEMVLPRVARVWHGFPPLQCSCVCRARDSSERSLLSSAIFVAIEIRRELSIAIQIIYDHVCSAQSHAMG